MTTDLSTSSTTTPPGARRPPGLRWARRGTGRAGAGLLAAALAVAVLPVLAQPAAAVEVPDAPFGTQYSIQTNGPGGAITLGDWYTAPTASGGGNQPHLLELNVPCSWPAGTAIQVDLFSAAFNRNTSNPGYNLYEEPGGDGSFGTATYTLTRPNGTTAQSTPYPSVNTATDAWSRFTTLTAPVACGTYLLTSAMTGDDQNGWRVRFGSDNDGNANNAPPANSDNPDGISGTDDELTVGLTRITYQHDLGGTAARCLTLYEYVNPGLASVRFHNFDLDNVAIPGSTVRYYAPGAPFDPTGASGGIVGDISGNGVWNNPGGTETTTRAGDLITAAAAPEPTNTATVRSGWWRILTCASDHNQFIQEAQAGEPVYFQQPPTPQLTIAKTDGTTVLDPGQRTTYTVTLNNVSSGTTAGAATSVVVTDTLPAGLTPVSCALGGGAAGTCLRVGTTQQLRATFTDDVPAGASRTFTVVADVVTTGAPASFTNSVSAVYSDSIGNPYVPVTATDVDTLGAANLSVTKTAVGSFTVGNPGSYTISVANAGGGTRARLVRVVDTLPAGLSFTSVAQPSPWTCTAAGQTVTCDLSGDLAAGSTSAFTLNVGVAAAAFPTTTNPATVSSATNDPTPANNTTSVTTPVAAASIGDRVFDDTNGNGLLDAGEPGRNGVTVELLASNGTTVLATTTTATAGGVVGSYAFTGLAPGTFFVRFTAPGGRLFTLSDAGVDDAVDSDADRTTGRSGSVTVTAGQALTTVDAGTVAPASIGDLVFDDVNGNGIFDGGDTPLAGRTVTLSAGATTVATTTTATDGSYLFTNLLAGSYAVTVGTPTGFSATGPRTSPSSVTLAVGQADLTQDFGFQQTNASIGDLVWNDLDGNGVQNGAEPGVGGVTLTLRRGATVVATTTSNASGAYLFPGLAAGDYTVTATTLPAGFTATTPNPAVITALAAGQVRDTADIGIRQTDASIGDTVFTDLDGNGTQTAGEPGRAGVVVTLSGGPTARPAQTTDAAGLYSFTGLAAGTYTVTLTVPTGFSATTVTTRTLTVGPGEARTDADYGVQQTDGSIGDLVFNDRNGNGSFDAGDAPLDNRVVTLTRNGVQVATDTTDAAGAYAFTGLAAGTYVVSVLTPVGFSATGPRTSPVTVVLGAGGVVTDVDLGFRQTNASLGDTVFSDLDGNGTQGPGETGTDGVTVELYDATGATLLATTTTATVGGTAGRYSFTGLAAGTYQVRVVAPAGFTVTTANPQTETLSAGQQLLTADFGLLQTDASIGDTVYDDLDGNGTQDAGEPGRSGLVVTLTRAGTPVATTTTGAGGTYSFTGLPAGSYVVDVAVPAGFSATTPDPRPVTLAAGQAVTDADVGIQRTDGSIGDRVYVDSDADGTQDAGEVGLAGRSVTLFRGADLIATAVTDGAGAYSFTGLPAGGYSVRVATPDGFTATGPSASPLTVTLTAGQAVDTADFGFVQTNGSIGDTVFTDTDGNGSQGPGEQARAGVTVTLNGTAPDGTPTSATTTTGLDGTYAFTGLRAGTYSVSVTPPSGFRVTTTDPVSVTLAAGQSVLTADFGVQQANRSIGDRVFDDLDGDGVQQGGEPGLGGVTVTLRRTGQPDVVTTTAPDGSYAFTGLPAGSYTVEVTVPAGRLVTTGPHPRPVTLTDAADVTDVDVGLQLATGRLGDTVFLDDDADGIQDPGEVGRAGVTVTLSTPGRVDRTTVTAVGGTYAFAALTAGAYTVTVTAPAGYATPAALTRTLTAGQTDLTVDLPLVATDGTIGDDVYNDVNTNGVRDAGEAGYSGVTVTLTPAVGPGQTTVTDPSGTYAFAGLNSANATYTVTIGAGLPAGALSTTGGGSTTVTLTAGQPSRSDVDFGYQQANGSIGDRVFLDRNGDGLRTPATEPGYANATVTLLYAGPNGTFGDGDDVSTPATTDSTGLYGFEGLVAGAYRVTLTVPAGLAATTATAFTRTLVTGTEAITDADFGLADGSVGDLVFLDSDGDGVAEEGGFSAPVTVTLTGGGLTTPRTATTSAGVGSYLFTGLTDGTYTVTVTVPAGSQSTTPTSVTAVVTDGVAVLDADFGLRVTTGTIGDRVWSDLDGDGVDDAGEPGLQGATLTLTDDGPDGAFGTADDAVRTTTTDANGAYSFGSLSAGDYRVAFTAPVGFTRTTPDAAVALTLAVGQSRLDVDFGAQQRNGSIGDTVFSDLDGDGTQDAGEPGIQGVALALSGPASSTAVTDANGAYLFTGLAAGTYSVQVTSPLTGFTATTPNPLSITVLAGQPRLTADFGYQPTSAAISGALFRDDNDNGAREGLEPGYTPTQTVTLTRGGSVVATTSTAPDGSYSFPGLPAGDYVVSITAPAGTRASTPTSIPVTLATAPVSGQDFGLAPATSSIGDAVINDLDGDGTPDAGEPGLQGAGLTLTDLGADGVLGGGDDTVVATTISAADGSYAFTGLTAGDYRVVVTAPGGFTTTGPSTVTVRLASAEAFDGADFTAEQTNALIGDLVFGDDNGNGLLDVGETGQVGVRLTLTGGDLTAPVTLDSLADGSYAFTGLAAGTYTVTATAPAGFALTTPASVTTALSPGQTFRLADFGLRQVPGSVTGSVFTDLDADGTRELGDDGRAGVAVTLRQGATVVATTSTASDGSYSFAGLPAGTYALTVTAPPGTQASTATTRTVTLTAAAPTASDQDFGVAPATASIGDRVWVDSDSDGVQDAGEPGRTGITVTLTRGGASVATQTTGANGAYSFTGLVAGDYVVTVTVPTGSTATTPASVAVALTSGSAVTDADFGLLQTNGSIGDLVYDDLDGDGVQDAGEPGLPGVVLTLSGGPTAAAPVTSGADGSYVFTGLAAGTYTVDVAVPPGRTATTPDPRTVTLAAGQAVITADFGLQRTDGSTSGVVFSDVDGDGTQQAGEPGRAGVTVTLARGGTPVATTLTGTDGDYAFTDLPPGSYTVTATVPAGATATTPVSGAVTVTTGPIAGPDVGLQPVDGTIGDLVFDDLDGDGLAGAGEIGLAGLTVTLTRGGAPVGTATTAGDGSYAFTGLPAGSYAVTVTVPSGRSATTPTSIPVVLAADGAVLTADFGIRRTDASIGDLVFDDLDQDGVRDAGEPGRGGVTVTLTQGTTTVATTSSDSTGAYLFTGLPAGDYTATVTLPTGTLGTRPLSVAVTLAPGAAFDTADFGVGTGSLGDLVFDDVDRDGVRDGGEAGLGGVTVTLVQGTTTLDSTTTAADGSYAFGLLPAGDYTVTVTVPGGRDATTATSFTRTIAAGASDLTLDFGLATTVNAAPVFGPAPTNTAQTVPVGSPLAPLTATDADGDPLTFAVETGTLPPGVVLGTNGTFTGTPTTPGTTTAVITVIDGKGGSASTTLVVTVTPVGSPPVAVDDSRTTPSGVAVTLDPRTNDTDADNDALTVTAVGPATNGTVACSTTSCSYTPNPGFVGTDSFDYTLSDGTRTDVGTVTVTVTNTPPVFGPEATNDAQSTGLGRGLTPLTASDADGDPLVFTLTTGSLPPGVTLTPAGAFTGTATEAGTFTATITVADGKGGTDTTTLVVTVAPNGAPVFSGATGNTAQTIPVGGTPTPVTATDPDPGQAVTYTVTGGTLPAGVTLAPDGSFGGSATTPGTTTVTVTATDPLGATDTTDLVITVTPAPDRAPDAVDDTASTPRDTPVTTSVLSNDTDPDGDPLTVASATQPANGSVSCTASACTYAPAPGFTGTDSFTYTVSDGRGLTDTATVRVTVIAPPNSAPAFTTAPGNTAQTVPVGGTPVPLQATDPDDDPLVFTVTTGTLPPGLVLQPDGSFTGTATTPGSTTVTITVSDGRGGTDTTSVALTIVVAAGNPPVAVDDSATTPAGTPVRVVVLTNDTDPDAGDVLTVLSWTQAGNGTVSCVNGGAAPGCSYTPAVGFSGTDTFTYVVTDGTGGTDAATVTVTVTPPANSAPAFTGATGNTAQTVPVGGTPVQVTATDPDGDPLTYTVVTGPLPPGVTLAPNGTFGGAATTPGTYPVTIGVSDGRGGTASTTVTITVVAPVNQPPVAVDDTATAASAPVTVPVLGNDTDANGDPLTVASFSQPANGTVTCTAAACTYTPAAGFTGTDTFTYVVSDGRGGTDTATVTLTVTAPNRVPVAADDTATTAEDTPRTLLVLGNDTDPDGDPLTVTVGTQPQNGAVTCTATQCVYTPDPGYSGPDSFTYAVSDGRGGTDTATVTLTVTGANDAPVAVDDRATTGPRTPVTIPVLGNDNDPEGDQLVVTSFTQPANGAVSCTASACAYTPDAGFTGTDAFTYTVSDGNGGTDTATVTVVVTNRAPVANPDVVTVVAGETATVVVLTNDTDPDGDPLTVTSATQPTHGTVSCTAVVCRYTPDPGYVGTDTFTYAVSDGNGGTDTTTVSVVVTADDGVGGVDTGGNGGPGGNGGVGGNGGTGGIPRTGTDVPMALGVSATLLLLGLLLLLAGRREDGSATA